MKGNRSRYLVVALMLAVAIEISARSLRTTPPQPLWIEAALESELACLGGPSDFASELVGINRSEASKITSYSDVFNRIGMTLFMYGEGPLDLTCSDPFASMAALIECPDLTSSSLKKEGGVLCDLCSEGPRALERRFQHCLSLVLASGPISSLEARMVYSDRAVSHQFALCSYVARCTLPVMVKLCHDFVSILQRKNAFCASGRHRSILRRRCAVRWPGIVATKWSQLLAAAKADALSDPPLFLHGMQFLSSFGSMRRDGGIGDSAEERRLGEDLLFQSALRLGEDVRRVNVELGMLPQLQLLLLSENRSTAARTASLASDVEAEYLPS